jgi:hypothetical protein
MPFMEGLRMKNTVTFISIATAMLLLNGCSNTTAVAPTSIDPRFNGSQLTGYVTNSVTGPIDAVRVSVTAGPYAGTSTLTGTDGLFLVPFDFRTAGEVAFAKDGFAPVVVSIPVRQSQGAIAIDLHFATPPLSLRGVDTATFVADASCTQIPERLRTRSYHATVDQAQAFPQDTRFDVTLTGAAFATGTLRGASLDSFFGFVEGNSVGLTVANLFESGQIAEGIAEQIAPGVLLEIYGNAMASVDNPANVSMPMTGYFALTDASGTRICHSSNHRVVLTRSANTP